jgi:hypothetical protein
MAIVTALAVPGLPTRADDELVRPNTPPDLILLCAEETGTYRLPGPVTAEIWFSQSLVSWMGKMYRARINTSTILFGLVDEAVADYGEINRVTGHWSVSFLIRKSLSGDALSGNCERAAPKF